MDYLISFALIIAIMLFMGFSVGDILLLVLGIIGLGVILIGGFFAVCLVFLAVSKRRTAVFLDINEEGRFPCAVYMIDGERVNNLFPCEMIMQKRLYVPDKPVTLLYCGIRKAAIDANALATIIVGNLIFIPASVFVVIQTVRIIPEMFG